MRERQLGPNPHTLIYDGKCVFCISQVKRILWLDISGKIKAVDFHSVADLKSIHPELDAGLCHSELQLITRDGRRFGGFFAFRRLSRALAFLYILVPVLYFPGMHWVGCALYKLIAKNRYLFHRKNACRDNHCVSGHPPEK